MKILFVSRRFYPEIIGGGQISPLYIAKALKKLGAEVHVLTFGEKRAEYNIFGVQIHREPIKEIPGMKVFSNMDYMWMQIAKAADRFAQKLKPDVVHLLNFESILTTSISLKKKYPHLPIFATANGPLFECFTGAAIDYNGETCIKCNAGKRLKCCAAKWGAIKGRAYWIYSLWYRKLLRGSYKRIDKFFPVSRAMVEVLKNAGIAESKMVIVHNPIDLRKKIRTGLKKELGLEGRKILLYAGRLAEDKGVQDIIRVVALIPETALVVVGKGPYAQKLRELANGLGVAGRVKFEGFVKHEKLGGYYSVADLVVFPCTIYESLSRMLLEAASYGIPIVASDVGGNSEIVENGKNGVLLKDATPKKIAEAARMILGNKKAYARMSKYAKQKILKEFAPEKIARKLVEEYKHGIANPAR